MDKHLFLLEIPGIPHHATKKAGLLHANRLLKERQTRLELATLSLGS